jgi:serine/threonine-protein kinase
VRGESHEGRRWVGRVLRDRWRIDARISRGGVGTVYAATHKNNGSRAAIKVLHPEFSRDADTRSRFLQEGYAANQVNHPGVVRILDDDTSEDGHAYLVMELLEGELLETRRVRKGGRLPLADVYEVGEQLLDVLAAAHDKGIVHRDIKPDNLFITHEGRLKVLDFGFAQMKSTFRPEQTATGFLLGTPGFMSPEQAVGNRPQIDAQTDIWAVGATLFMLVSGEAPHAGESAAEMLVAAANFPPRSLATVTSGLNPRLVHVVDRAVAFEKAKRWPNARAMQHALRDVSGKQAAGQVSRRSIPDDAPTLYEDDSMEIEELDASDLEDAKASWGSVTGRDDSAVPNEDVTDEAMPSAITRPVPGPIPRQHPADEDGPTLSAPSATTDPVELAPHAGDTHTPHMGIYPISAPGPGMMDAQSDSGTLIMESPANAFSQTQPYSQGSGPPQQTSQSPPYGPSDQLFRATDPRGMNPQDLRHLVHGAGSDAMYSAAPSSAAQTQPVRAQGGNRVLMFIGVALCTMVLVIVAGLIILSASD